MASKSRPYRNEGDYRRLRDLVIETHSTSVPPLNRHVGDLDWWLFRNGFDRIASSRVWEDESGKLIGLAWPNGDEVDLFVHSERREIEAAMIAWAEQRRADARLADADPWRLCAWATAGDRPREEILLRRGYDREAYFLRYGTRSLDEPIPEPSLPAGYSIRSYRGQQDLARRVAVHLDAFDPSQYTAEKHRCLQQAPTYRMDQDLVVVAPDGTFAAFCIVWYDRVNRVGKFEPVGAHSRHRRRGLGKALLLAGMRLMKKLGATAAIVEGRGDNVPASRLYGSLGFDEKGRYCLWKKAL